MCAKGKSEQSEIIIKKNGMNNLQTKINKNYVSPLEEKLGSKMKLKRPFSAPEKKNAFLKKRRQNDKNSKQQQKEHTNSTTTTTTTTTSKQQNVIVNL